MNIRLSASVLYQKIDEKMRPRKKLSFRASAKGRISLGLKRESSFVFGLTEAQWFGVLTMIVGLWDLQVRSYHS